MSCGRNLHSPSAGPVTVVLPASEIDLAVELQFLLKGELVKLAAERELAIHFFLADVEIFNVEEACIGN